MGSVKNCETNAFQIKSGRIWNSEGEIPFAIEKQKEMRENLNKKWNNHIWHTAVCFEGEIIQRIIVEQ